MGKKEIVEAAERLFSANGYAATTVRDIAGSVGIKAGSLYTHIESKHDLLFTIIDRASDDFLSAAESVSAMDAPPRKRLDELMRRHLNLVADKLDGHRVFFHEWRALTGEQFEVVLEKRRRYERMITDLIEDGVRAGEFVTPSPRLAAIGVLSILNWSYHWFSPAGPMTADQVAEFFSDLVSEGLAPTRTPQAEATSSAGRRQGVPASAAGSDYSQGG